MSSHRAIADFADTMITRFPPFRQWEDYQEKAWADDLVTELSSFSAEAIERAQREIIRNRKKTDPRPPMVSECIAACVEARNWLEREKSGGKLPAMRDDTTGDSWSTERQRLAYDLIKSSLGRQAANDDPCWISSLWTFCRKNQRLPQGQEIDRCKREAREFDQTYAFVVRGDQEGRDGLRPLDESVRQMLEKLGAGMLDERKRLVAEVLGN